ncbi:restriction endonuclease subunit S, partial [Bacillus toyonensis]|uniref:restriction endonuclease subunit S n=1 Tax=Bacillus toyonensis TaxID=155322 RepID=UPI003000E5C5
FWYMFNSVLIRKQLSNKITTTAGQNTINQKNIGTTIIPIPPTSEQKRIVEKVNQLMSLCDELEMHIEQSKQESEKLMKAVLQEAFMVKEEVLS